MANEWPKHGKIYVTTGPVLVRYGNIEYWIWSHQFIFCINTREFLYQEKVVKFIGSLGNLQEVDEDDPWGPKQEALQARNAGFHQDAGP